jgi:hydroxymethylbilane synthase
MLPAPAQGAIMVVCREDDAISLNACKAFNDSETALCTKIERDFLRTLLGGCSTPISALAQLREGNVYFRGNILTVDGKQKIEIEKNIPLNNSDDAGSSAANELLQMGADTIVNAIQHAK